MHAKRLMILTPLLCSMLLSGCWDRREINDVAFVVASAIDKKGDEYQVTVQIPLPGQLGGIGGSGGGGGTTGEKSFYVDSATGKTLRAANRQQQRSLSRQLYFAHSRVMLIGEELAKDNISPIMDVMARVPQNRLTSFALIARGEAKSLLSAEVQIEQFPAEMMRELAQSSMKNPVNMRQLIETMLSDGIDPVIPAIEKIKTSPGGKEDPKSTLQVDGLAVFRGSRLQGYIPGDQSIGVLLAMNEAKKPTLIVQPPEGEGNVSIQLQETNTKIEPRVQGDKITVRVILEGKGSINENESTFDIAYDNNLEKMEKKLNQQTQKILVEGIRQLQTYQSDALGIGDKIYRSEPAQWRKLRQNWSRHFSEIKFEAESNLHLEHVGSVTMPLGRKDGEMKR